MRTLTVYHQNGTKSVQYRQYGPHSKSSDLSNKPQHERVTRAYYDLECSHKLKPGKNYARIKSIWQQHAARAEAGLI